MLVLSRRIGETIVVDEKIEITVVDVQGDMVKIGINAPRDISIFRQEIYQEIQAENLRASQNLNKNKDGLEKMKKFKQTKDIQE